MMDSEEQWQSEGRIRRGAYRGCYFILALMIGMLVGIGVFIVGLLLLFNQL